MSTPDDGGPAFPMPPVGTGDLRDGMTSGSSGMSLRDYFAAKAMAGLIAASGNGDGGVDYDEESVAESAYAMADAMLAVRSAPRPT